MEADQPVGVVGHDRAPINVAEEEERIPYFYIITNTILFSIEYNDPILFGTAKKLIFATLGNAFYKDFELPTHTTLIGSSRKFVLQRNNFVQSRHFNFLRYIVLQML